MEVKTLNNVLEIFFVFTKASFYISGPFAVVVGAFKFRESFFAIVDIKSVFRYI